MDPRYPVGRYEDPVGAGAAERARWIEEIAALPSLIREAVSALPPGGLDRPYRVGGWTARQVVHHLADSHLNSYVRFRLALTEQTPTVKPYDEAAWAELDDARTAPADLSLALLDHLHVRWILLLRSISDEQWARRFRHPEMGERDLTQTLALYAWHGRHHLAHIKLAGAGE